MAPLPGQLQKKTILVLLRKLAENSDKMAEAILGYKRWSSSSGTVGKTLVGNGEGWA